MTDLISRLRALSRHEHDDLTIGDEAADALAGAWGRDDIMAIAAVRDALAALVAESSATPDAVGKWHALEDARQALAQVGGPNAAVERPERSARTAC